MKNKNQIVDVAVMDDVDKGVAERILNEHPALAAALSDFQSSYENAIGRLRGVVLEIRKAKLTPYEQTCILAKVGFQKGRISEIKKIANDTETNVKRFIDGDVSFRVAYKNARATSLPPAVPVHPAKPAMEKCAAFVRSLVEGDLPKKKSTWETWHFGCLIRIQFRPGKVTAVKAPKPTAKKKKAKPAASDPVLPLGEGAKNA